MGFRNPVTTATDVDTGQPDGAGVRVYQKAVTGGTAGVVEFRDGIAGDTPSTLTAQANLVPQGGGYTAQGGGFAMDAGSFNGVDGPKWDLRVEEAGAGGYRPVARLTGADVVDIAGLPVPVNSTDERAAALADRGNAKGTTVIRLDTPDAREERWDGTKWRASTQGHESLTSDAGGNIVVPHGLGAVPTKVLVTPGAQLSDLLQRIVDFTWTNADAFSFVVVLRREDTNAVLGPQTVRFSWQAFT